MSQPGEQSVQRSQPESSNWQQTGLWVTVQKSLAEMYMLLFGSEEKHGMS